MNKKGFLRIAEATISIVIIAGVLFLFFSQAREAEKPDLSEMARDILEEISRSSLFRERILDYNANSDPPGDIPQEIEDYVGGRIPGGYLNYKIRICDVNSACGIEYVEAEVYSAERLVSSTLNNLNTKKIRLFIWEVSG